MQTIVIATDGSPASQEAIEFGLELAEEHGAGVTFVHVVPPNEFVRGRLGAVAIPHEEPVDESEAVLHQAAEAGDDTAVPYSLERVSAPTVDGILAVADRQDADLIVTGCHGRGAIGTALLGSVSSGLVKRATRPVLVVKAHAHVTA